MRILYSKYVSEKYKDSLRDYFKSLSFKPILAVVEVGEVSDNRSYLNSIFKLSLDMGVFIQMYRIKLETSEASSDIEISESYSKLYPNVECNFVYTSKNNLSVCLDMLLKNLSDLSCINGLLLMSKMNYGLSYKNYLNSITYLKDVDSVTATNIQKLYTKEMYNNETLIDVGITIKDNKIYGDVKSPVEGDSVLNYTPVSDYRLVLTTLMLFKNLKILIEQQKDVV